MSPEGDVLYFVVSTAVAHGTIYFIYAIYREVMAKRCELCGKGPVVGRNISHAHNVTPRRFEPNLQRVRALVNGGIRRLRVCTRCLRSNKVVKAA